MMKKKKWFKSLSLAGLVLVLTAGLALAGARGVTDEEVTLGMVLVKTGPVAALGIPQGNGMVDYMNSLLSG